MQLPLRAGVLAGALVMVLLADGIPLVLPASLRWRRVRQIGTTAPAPLALAVGIGGAIVLTGRQHVSAGRPSPKMVALLHGPLDGLRHDGRGCGH